MISDGLTVPSALGSGGARGEMPYLSVTVHYVPSLHTAIPLTFSSPALFAPALSVK